MEVIAQGINISAYQPVSEMLVADNQSPSQSKFCSFSLITVPSLIEFPALTENL